MDDLNIINPFSDPSFKKKILEKEGLLEKDNKDDVYEILSPVDSGTDNQFKPEPGKMIMPDLKIPKSASNIIHDASVISSRDKLARSKEISTALNRVFSEYNEKYGLSLKINFDNISETLVAVSDPIQRRSLELYLSESFKSFRATVYLKIMSSLALIIDNILDPVKLSSNDVEYSDKFIIVEKCLQFCDQIENLKKSITIVGAETEMSRLSEESNKPEDENLDSKAIKDFMKSLLSDEGISS